MYFQRILLVVGVAVGVAMTAALALDPSACARELTAAPAAARASTEEAGHEAARAIDGDATTSWCAAETGAEPDWWEIALDHATVGAIRMRSGRIENGRVVGHKARALAWSYQRAGDPSWHLVAGADTRANRAQIVVRFEPVQDVVRLRATFGARDPAERTIVGADNPCLREVQFFDRRDERIHVRPWFWAVSTWEEGANVFRPLLHYDWEAFHVRDALERAVGELEGARDPDTVDELWIGELGEPWVTAEPAPAAFLYSGNYKNYVDVDAETYRPFFGFVRGPGLSYPMLGACGGHQLLAMAFAHPTFESFRTEFGPAHPDSMSQVVVTCSTNPAYGCGTTSAVDCCYEGGEKNPFRHLAPNVPGAAMPNPYMTAREDMLFNLIPPHDGFEGYLYHSDYVDPAKIAASFDVIATYSKEVRETSRTAPTLVQAMKLKGRPIYGTQFHFDENASGDCHRGDGDRDMDRVLRNFALIALGQHRGLIAHVSSNSAAAKNLFDLDRASLWCADGHAGSVTLEFEEPADFGAVLTVQGRDRAQARRQRTSYDVSDDGVRWRPLNARRRSLFATQVDLDSCGGRTGREDGQSYIDRVSDHNGDRVGDRSGASRFLRVNVSDPDSNPCLRELMVLKL